VAITSKVCIAGFGQKVSVWATIRAGRLTGFNIEEPKRHEAIESDAWFDDYLLLVPVNSKNGPRKTKICPYLTAIAGRKAAEALRDYSITNLAMALISHYGWQVANSAKPLTEHNELAKVYAGNYALYVFETRDATKQAQLKLLAAKS
jgi:hypothetical protein